MCILGTETPLRNSMSFFSFLFCSGPATCGCCQNIHRRLRSVYFFIIIICQMFGAMLNNHLSISNIILYVNSQ